MPIGGGYELIISMVIKEISLIKIRSWIPERKKSAQDLLN